jgi:hypothetical protein
MLTHGFKESNITGPKYEAYHSNKNLIAQQFALKN